LTAYCLKSSILPDVVVIGEVVGDVVTVVGLVVGVAVTGLVVATKKECHQ